MKKIIRFRYLPTVIFALIIISLWEWYSGSFDESRLFLPAPTSIFRTFLANKEIIFSHTVQTVLETVIGFIIAVFTGLTFSLLFALSPFTKRTVYPLLVVSQTIPLIILAPLLLIWFGFGMTPKIIMVVLFCFFPITIATTDALINVNQDLIDLFKSMNATNLQILQSVRFPSSLPAFFSGMKIAATYGVTGAIVGEFVGAKEGLGIYMNIAASSHAFALVFAVIAVVVILSLLLFTVIAVLERLVIPWHFQQTK